jgi:lambda repressor-like predicted transcriptional regulator
MNGTRWLATAAAALAVVLGGSTALATTGSSNPASDFLGDVAKRLGVSQDELEDAIDDATIARIDAAVAAGDITKEEGDALKERVRAGEGPAILPGFRGPGVESGPFGHHGAFGPGEMAGTDLLDAAAEYLGMDGAELREALHEGKSLAQLANDEGKSVDGLKQALREEIRKDADQAVEDGVLTNEQADRLVDKLSDAVDELVENPGAPILEFGFREPGPGLGPPGPPETRMFPGVFPSTDLMESAADYLGMDAAELREALRDGKSLADLANDKGKSVDGLKQALRDEIRKDADQAVEDGVVTREQADRFVEKLGTAIDELVEGSGGGGFGFDFGDPDGKPEFHYRIEPEGGIPPPPEGQGSSALEPAIVPARPI